MSKFSRMIFCLFVAWNIQRVVFLPIFVFWWFLFCWCLCCLFFWSAFLNVVFESLYRCIDTIFNAGVSSSSFFSWHIQSIHVISWIQGPMHRHKFSCFLVHLFTFFPHPFQEWSRISYKRNSLVVYSIDEIFPI